MEWFHLTNSVFMLKLWYFFFCHQWFGEKKLFLLILLSDLALCDVVSTQTMEQWPSFSKWAKCKVQKQTSISDLYRNTYSPRTILGALKQNLWLVAGSQRTRSQGQFWSMSATSLRTSRVEGRLHNNVLQSNISKTMATTVFTGFLQPVIELSFPSKSSDEGRRVSRLPSLSIQMIRWWSEWSGWSRWWSEWSRWSGDDLHDLDGQVAVSVWGHPPGGPNWHPDGSKCSSGLGGDTFLLKGGVLPVGRPRSEIPYGDRTWTLGEQASIKNWNIFYNKYILTTRFRATYGNKLWAGHKREPQIYAVQIILKIC